MSSLVGEITGRMSAKNGSTSPIRRWLQKLREGGEGPGTARRNAMT